MKTSKVNFSIVEAVRGSWQIFLQRPWFYVAIVLVLFVLKVFGSNRQPTLMNVGLSILVIIATIIWQYIWISISLASVDGQVDLLNFKSINKHMPNVSQFFTIIGLGLLVGLCIVLGTVLLIIPGIYIGVHLAFSNIAYIDRKESITKSMKYSWGLVKGNFWKILLVLLVVGLIMLVGFLAFGIGILVTYPVAYMTLIKLYRALIANQNTAISPQPVEIPPAQS